MIVNIYQRADNKYIMFYIKNRSLFLFDNSGKWNNTIHFYSKNVGLCNSAREMIGRLKLKYKKVTKLEPLIYKCK